METNSSLNEPITVNENYWHKFHPIHPYWHYAYAILFSIIGLSSFVLNSLVLNYLLK